MWYRGPAWWRKTAGPRCQARRGWFLWRCRAQADTKYDGYDLCVWHALPYIGTVIITDAKQRR